MRNQPCVRPLIVLRSMLGGTLSMIGSSTNLVAANAAAMHDPSFAMKVFDISAIGAVNALAGTAYMVLTGRKLLPFSPPATPNKRSAGSAAATAPPRGTTRLWLTLALITATMTIASQAPKALVPVALGCLCMLVRTGCVTLKEAWSAVNGPVLLSIALSFALGEAIKKSDLAGILAGRIVDVVAPYGTLALLFAIYAVAILIGAVISNNAVVALMFPIVVRICEGAGARASARGRGQRASEASARAIAASARARSELSASRSHLCSCLAFLLAFLPPCVPAVCSFRFAILLRSRRALPPCAPAGRSRRALPPCAPALRACAHGRLALARAPAPKSRHAQSHARAGWRAGISWKPALYALTLAASASFSTPVSYQTNLMVAADAGYSFGDFIKFGVPLQLVWYAHPPLQPSVPHRDACPSAR